jgi:hypothetical protein
MNGTRKVFLVGHIFPSTVACPQNEHDGPLIEMERFLAYAGDNPELWKDMGRCPKCGSTIHVSQIKP